MLNEPIEKERMARIERWLIRNKDIVDRYFDEMTSQDIDFLLFTIRTLRQKETDV